jgi:hypothetical protein
VSSIAHLSRRFVGSVSRRPVAVDDELWALSFLGGGERALWHRMNRADRRHAVVVGRRFAAERGGDVDRATVRPVMAAALLHDVGKVDGGLGTFGRVGATVWIRVAGRDRVQRGDGRIARYARHEPLGAELLVAAGSDPITVALVGGTADAPADVLAALHAADDI